MAYRNGFLPPESPKPLELGIALHVGWEHFYSPEHWSKTTPEEKAQRAIDAFVAECEKQRLAYLKKTNQEGLISAEGDDYADRCELGINMLNWYAEHVHPVKDKWFKPVYVEVPFQVPIVSPLGAPLTCPVDDGSCGQLHPANAPVTFDGRIDMIIEDLYQGGFLIWDHKSAAQIRKDDRVLRIDPQVGGYSWAMLVAMGLDIRGFVYVEYRKDYPKPPTALKRSYKGRLFTTDKNFGTDYKMYMETIERLHPEGLKAGVYDEHLEWLKGKEAPRYHERFPIIKGKKQLLNFGESIYQVAREMVRPDLAVYPSVGTYSCSGCAFYTPCEAMFNGEDYMHSLTTSYRNVKWEGRHELVG
jgi:hypothetical protein